MDFERDDWFLCIAAIQIGVPQRRLHCLTNWNTPYARAAAAPRRGAARAGRPTCVAQIEDGSAAAQGTAQWLGEGSRRCFVSWGEDIHWRKSLKPLAHS